MRTRLGAKELIELGRASCPSGRIWRKGYTTRRGVRVKGTCIPDKGKPGKGPKTLPKPRLGGLKGWKKSNPVSKNRNVLTKAARRKGCGLILKRLNLLANITADKPTERMARSDAAWLRKSRICKDGRGR